MRSRPRSLRRSPPVSRRRRIVNNERHRLTIKVSFDSREQDERSVAEPSAGCVEPWPDELQPGFGHCVGIESRPQAGTLCQLVDGSASGTGRFRAFGGWMRRTAWRLGRIVPTHVSFGEAAVANPASRLSHRVQPSDCVLESNASESLARCKRSVLQFRRGPTTGRRISPSRKPTG